LAAAVALAEDDAALADFDPGDLAAALAAATLPRPARLIDADSCDAVTIVGACRSRALGAGMVDSASAWSELPEVLPEVFPEALPDALPDAPREALPALFFSGGGAVSPAPIDSRAPDLERVRGISTTHNSENPEIRMRGRRKKKKKKKKKK
jgi:hypothetical protein